MKSAEEWAGQEDRYEKFNDYVRTIQRDAWLAGRDAAAAEVDAARRRLAIMRTEPSYKWVQLLIAELRALPVPAELGGTL